MRKSLLAAVVCIGLLLNNKAFSETGPPYFPKTVFTEAAFIATRFGEPYQKMLKISENAYLSAKRKKVPFTMVLAIIATESSFHRRALSDARCMGLMQVDANSIPSRLSGHSVWDVHDNIRMGIDILKRKLRYANQDWPKALALYNGSFGVDANYVNTVYSWYYAFRAVSRTASR